jgi:pimeloyl-ACP methyl ester carboxylesterase
LIAGSLPKSNNNPVFLFHPETIVYESAGDGPPLVLLHGFCESSRIFHRLKAELCPHSRVLLPNLPGHGGTPREPGLRSLSDAADWLRDWLDLMEVETCLLVGHSLGGYIAAAFADRYPDRLKGIGMLHSTALGDSPDRQENRDKALAFISEYGTEAYLRAFVASLFFDPQPAWTAELHEITAGTDPASIISFIKAMRDRPDRVAALRALQVPVMYIMGELDSLVPPARIRDELARVELALLYRIPDAGHMGMYETPDKVLAAINSLVELAG